MGSMKEAYKSLFNFMDQNNIKQLDNLIVINCFDEQIDIGDKEISNQFLSLKFGLEDEQLYCDLKYNLDDFESKYEALRIKKIKYQYDVNEDSGSSVCHQVLSLTSEDSKEYHIAISHEYSEIELRIGRSYLDYNNRISELLNINPAYGDYDGSHHYVFYKSKGILSVGPETNKVKYNEEAMNKLVVGCYNQERRISVSYFNKDMNTFSQDIYVKTNEKTKDQLLFVGFNDQVELQVDLNRYSLTSKVS